MNDLRTPHQLTNKKGVLSYAVWKHFILVVGIVAVLFFCNRELFLAQQLVAEDSFFFYQTAYNEPIWKSLSTPYAGYFHLVPMLFAELFWNVPFEVLPLVNHLAALFVSTFLLSWLYTPFCRNLVPSDAFRAMGVILLGLMPYQPNLSFMMGLNWYIAIFVGLILVSEIPQNRFVVTILSGLAVLGALSGPGTVVFLPVACYFYIRNRKNLSRYLYLSFAVAIGLHLGLVALLLKQLASLPQYAEAAVAWEAMQFIWWNELLSDTFLGKWIEIGKAGFVVKIVTIVLLLYGGYHRLRRYKDPCILFLLYGAISVLALSMMRGQQSLDFLEKGSNIERYYTIPAAMLIVVMIITVSDWYRHCLAQFQMQRTLKYGKWIVLCAIIGIHLFDVEKLAAGYPIEEAFSHKQKARVFRAYEERVSAGGEAETVAFPGWYPEQFMRLKIGGGRHCEDPYDIFCIFGQELKSIGSGTFESSWLGPFEVIDHTRIRVLNVNWGMVNVVGYSNGYYWFRRPDQSLFLSGPAIFPKAMNFPFEGYELREPPR